MNGFTQFTPASAALGGLLIGLASVWLMLALGRIAGISGLLRSAVWPDDSERAWRLAFLAGMLGAAWCVFGLTDAAFVPRSGYSSWVLIAGGALVGYGTSLGSGCTSGHGVCGLARFSPRSLAATVAFVGVGMATATLVYLAAGRAP